MSTAELQKPGAIYIGRGSPHLGLTGSKWGNPFPINKKTNRKEAIRRFKRHLETSTSLQEALEELGGKTLCCHCPLHMKCHGDALIDAFNDKFGSKYTKPPGDKDIEAAINTRDPVTHKIFSPPSTPTIYAGTGDPLLVNRGAKQRLLVDGGGGSAPPVSGSPHREGQPPRSQHEFGGNSSWPSETIQVPTPT